MVAAYVAERAYEAVTRSALAALERNLLPDAVTRRLTRLLLAQRLRQGYLPSAPLQLNQLLQFVHSDQVSRRSELLMNECRKVARFQACVRVKIAEVRLSNEPDRIEWKWTQDGSYSAKTAYLAQYDGSYSTIQGDSIWKAEAEGKHKFFAWLLLQSKILTTNKLIKRNWPCNPVCALCRLQNESAAHLCLHCPYANEVWDHIRVLTDGFVDLPQQGDELEGWWIKALAGLPKQHRRHKAAILMYTAWNLWKERNRRIFQGKESRPIQVIGFIKEEMAIRQHACGAPEFP